jgi:hypothetical protein
MSEATKIEILRTRAVNLRVAAQRELDAVNRTLRGARAGRLTRRFRQLLRRGGTIVVLEAAAKDGGEATMRQVRVPASRMAVVGDAVDRARRAVLLYEANQDGSAEVRKVSPGASGSHVLYEGAPL